MSRIKGKDTRLEKQFYAAWALRNIKEIECNPSDVLGKPDFVHRKSKTAVFLDSCFWHGCALHLRMPHSNSDYWKEKIERNKKRDNLVTQTLRKEGWSVIRIWGHSLKSRSDFEKWTEKVAGSMLKKSASSQKRERTTI